MKKFLQYLKYYFEPKDSELRAEAYEAAKAYYRKRPLRTKDNPYPRFIEYTQRLDDTVAFQRGYKSRYRHEYAMEKIRQSTMR